MHHGGDIYRNKVRLDHSVSLNPLPLPQVLKDAMQSGCEAGAVYPDPEQEALRNALAEGLGVEPGCVIAGNGASELILAAVRAVDPGRVLLVEPGFTGYRHALQSLKNCEVTEYRVTEEEGFSLTERFLDAVTPETDLIILCDPGNPAGRNIDPALLGRILDRARDAHVTVLLDQSFYLLSTQGQLHGSEPRELIGKYEDLIILRSYTKVLGLPGIRMGMAVSRERNVEMIRMQLPEWNVSAVAEQVMMAGEKMIRETDFCANALAAAKEEGAYLKGALEALGCTVYPTDTIYLLFHAPREICEPLLERGILIRDCKDLPGLSPGFCRIAVRDRASDRDLIRNMEEVLRGH